MASGWNLSVTVESIHWAFWSLFCLLEILLQLKRTTIEHWHRKHKHKSEFFVNNLLSPAILLALVICKHHYSLLHLCLVLVNTHSSITSISEFSIEYRTKTRRRSERMIIERNNVEKGRTSPLAKPWICKNKIFALTIGHNLWVGTHSISRSTLALPDLAIKFLYDHKIPRKNKATKSELESGLGKAQRCDTIVCLLYTSSWFCSLTMFFRSRTTNTHNIKLKWTLFAAVESPKHDSTAITSV